MKSLFYLSALLFISSFSFSQSISGNLNSKETKLTLGYGNVDIYQGEKLVASVLTDKSGNFNVALDTGFYKCVVNYSGYEPIVKTMHITKNEKVDFTMKEDRSKPKSVNTKNVHASTEIHSTRIRKDESEIPTSVISRGILDEKSSGLRYNKRMINTDEITLTGRSNVLTAGEINDFSKWTMWQDIAENELNTYQKNWNIAPKGRYTVSVHGKTGLPIVDALVNLKLRGGKTLFTSRTDNTGKAELWLNIKNETPFVNGQLEIEIEHNGEKTHIRSIQPFEKSINHHILDVSCEEVDNVDIAFVVDATGSMGDELSFLQAEMNDIIFQSKQISSKLNFRFGNVFYRDKGTNEAYLTQTMDFNRILSESVQYINEQSAGGGGDYEEAVEIALDSAINNMNWSKKARARILFLILDAPPHNTIENQEKLQILIQQAAEKGIRIVPIGASGINKSTEYLMRCLALGTNGTYTFLTDHSGIGNSHIAPSTDKYDVETMNALMVRILKSYTYMPDCKQNIPDLQLNYADSLVVYPELKDTSIFPKDSLGTTTNTYPNDTVKTVKWTYYPNPTDGIVNIEADVDINELYITDLSGKVLQIVKNINKQRIIQVDLSQYSTGIYLIRYPLEKNWVSGKVILQRS